MTPITATEPAVTKARTGRPRVHREPITKSTVVLLRHHVIFLDNLALKIRTENGAVLRRAQILRALVDWLQETEPDLSGVTSELELKLRLETLAAGGATVALAAGR